MPDTGGAQDFCQVDLAFDPFDFLLQIAARTSQEICPKGIIGDREGVLFARRPEFFCVFFCAGTVMREDVNEFNRIKSHFHGFFNAGKLGDGSRKEQGIKAVGADCNFHGNPFLIKE